MSICAYNVYKNMKIEALIRIMAGSMVLVGLGLGHFLSPWWLLLSAFAAANLIQSAFTGFCPPSIVLSKLGWLDEQGVIHWGGRRGRG